jgi:hypothetical protein
MLLHYVPQLLRMLTTPQKWEVVLLQILSVLSGSRGIGRVAGSGGIWYNIRAWHRRMDKKPPGINLPLNKARVKDAESFPRSLL